jgi:chromosome segregation ATPase
MDTATATPTAKRAVELRKQLAGLYTRKREAESALAREHDTQQKATAERITLVAELVDADSATAGWAHREIDRLDSALRVSSRLSEGLSNSISRMTSENESLSNELQQVERAIAAEEHAEGLRVFAAQLNQARRSAEEALGNARAALAALNLAAARGFEQYGVAAQSFATGLLEEFRHQQVNPELIGWRDSRPNYANLQLTVRPMVKG